jgi:hypothetical protein
LPQIKKLSLIIASKELDGTVLFKNDPEDDKWLSWTMREAGGRMDILPRFTSLETIAAKPISEAAKSTLQKIGLCCEKL